MWANRGGGGGGWVILGNHHLGLRFRVSRSGLRLQGRGLQAAKAPLAAIARNSVRVRISRRGMHFHRYVVACCI